MDHQRIHSVAQSKTFGDLLDKKHNHLRQEKDADRDTHIDNRKGHNKEDWDWNHCMTDHKRSISAPSSANYMSPNTSPECKLESQQ